jgi:hypothetical protein
MTKQTDPNTDQVQNSGGSTTRITLDDLLSSESEVLNRIARDVEDGVQAMAGHSSTTSGHRSGGTHTSHSSAKVERPLEE